MTNFEQISISIIEPTWNHRTHLPANLGVLRVVREAYPSARINFIGGAEQIEFLKEMAPPEVLINVGFHAWTTGEDQDTLPTDVYRTYKKLRKLPAEFTATATRIIFSSCTATTLAAATLLGLAPKSFAVLHGNANNLIGWRSRNPFRKAFDYYGAMKWFCKRGGTAIVLEDIIRIELGRTLPWLAPSLQCLPHPIAPEEAVSAHQIHNLNTPIRIAFAGNASIAKGFPEFLELATTLSREKPGQFEFHAFGYLPEESKGLDQSALTTKAKPCTLPRAEYVKSLSNMDHIFAWHNEKYYTMAASGIVYDAINFLVPLIARKTGQIAEWSKQGIEIGHLFDDINCTIKYFINTEHSEIDKSHNRFSNNITAIRKSLTIQRLGSHLSNVISIK